jgi:DNA-binding response OmpR family regulator
VALPEWETNAMEKGQSAGRHILLVDDDASLRRILRANLVKRGLLVREAASRESAVEALADVRPDVVILDLNLPDGSGQDVLGEVRRRRIAAYALVMSSTQLRSPFLTEFRPLAFLAKPFGIDDFLALVRHAVSPIDRNVVTVDNSLGGQTFETPALSAWVRELRATCHMLSRASPKLMRSVAVSLPLASIEGLSPSPLRLAEAIAEEYELLALVDISQGVLRVHLTRTPNGLDRSRGNAQ